MTTRGIDQAMRSAERVSYIGLGLMVRRLLDGGHDVVIWNRTAEKTKTLD
jgi:3-hydroxyisobutyrate dehydrogenase-like beta-hydroxyacid dehydrogenase